MSEKQTCQSCGHAGVCFEGVDLAHGAQDSPCRFDESRWISDCTEEEFFIVVPKGWVPSVIKAASYEFLCLTIERATYLGRAGIERRKRGVKIYRCAGRVIEEVKP